MRNLTTVEKDILMSKYHTTDYRRIKLLLNLLIECNMDYSKLSTMLKQNNLYGYSRTSIYNLIGKNIKKSTYKALLSEVQRGTIPEYLIQLIVSSNILKKYNDAWTYANGHPYPYYLE